MRGGFGESVANSELVSEFAWVDFEPSLMPFQSPWASWNNKLQMKWIGEVKSNVALYASEGAFRTKTENYECIDMRLTLISVHFSTSIFFI